MRTCGERVGNKSTRQTEFQVHLGQNVPLKHEDSTHDRNCKCENDGTVIICNVKLVIKITLVYIDI